MGDTFDQSAPSGATQRRADMPSPEACADEFARDLLEDRNSWKAVALANQATAQSHVERWSRAEAALQAIIDLGGAYGSRAWMVEADRIAREALAHNKTEERD